MARKLSLAAGVLSLILVGAWERAQAETQSVPSDTNTESITFMGKTVCTAQAPPTATCDWRLPSLETMRFAQSSSQAPLAASHAPLAASHAPLAASSDADPPKVHTLWGMNICFGDVPKDIECTFNMPEMPEAQRALRLVAQRPTSKRERVQ